MINKIKELKKVELHLHLDGAVEPSILARLSNKPKDELIPELIAKDKCENLSEYLTKFDLPISYMQTKNNLKLIAQELVNYLEKENVIYSEIRFAPMFHTKEGLSYEEVVESVLEGLRTNNNVKTNLILCMMRGFPRENNIHTIEVAKKYLGKGVCAIDLAGAEDKFPLKDYESLFEIVKEYNIPFTIHAGENGDHNEIELAINIGTKRIGHGILAIESEQTQKLLKENNVLLEVCPTSNIQTNAIDTYNNHPLKYFLEQDIKVCINTDNKTVSNISLTEEYIKLYNTFNFTIDDYIKMNRNAIDNAFLTEQEKQELFNKLN